MTSLGLLDLVNCWQAAPLPPLLPRLKYFGKDWCGRRGVKNPLEALAYPGEGAEGLWGEVPAHIQQGISALWCVCSPQILVSSAVIQGSYPELPCRLSPQLGGPQPPQHGSSPLAQPFPCPAGSAGAGSAPLLSSLPHLPLLYLHVYFMISIFNASAL